MPKKTKKGGSIASNKVNSLVSKCQHNNMTVNTHNVSKVNAKLIADNFGIDYKTTGGKKKKYGGASLKHPPLTGIPLSTFDKASDWFHGNKCQQSKQFARSSPLHQEFKYDTPAFSTDLNSVSKLNNRLPYALAGGKKKKSKKMIGSGSDWLSTHNSRGSYTAPNMPLKQFKQFNKTSPYISNVELANGAAKYFKASDFVKLPAQTPENNPPLAYNYYNSVQTKNFKGGKKTKKNIKKNIKKNRKYK